MDVWAQSNMRSWDGWKVRVQIAGDRCSLTLGRPAYDTVVGCWETRWSAMQCGDHGGLSGQTSDGRGRRSDGMPSLASAA
jgi:hypothetical protein